MVMMVKLTYLLRMTDLFMRAFFLMNAFPLVYQKFWAATLIWMNGFIHLLITSRDPIVMEIQ